MIEIIVLRSNIKINSYLENRSDKVGHQKYPFLRITDSVEIRVIIGLILFRSLLGLHNHKVFGATMGRNRFKFLLDNLMFDDFFIYFYLCIFVQGR